VLAGAFLAFNLLWDRSAAEALGNHPGSWAGAIALFVAGAIIHELLHEVAWKMAGHIRWADVYVGPSRRKLGLIVRLRVSIPARAYRFGLVLPAIVIGVFPILVGLSTGHGLATFWGMVFLFESFSDVAILLAIHHVAPHSHVVEDATRLGCRIVTPEP